MLLRLLLGLAKGLIVGGLIGFALAKAGIVAPGAIFAYLMASATGVAVGLVTGKPIWAKDAKIEAGMKAIVGALIGAGLMWAIRRWLSHVPIPFNLGTLGAVNTSLGDSSQYGTIGGLSLTSLATVGGVLGAFYDADNTPATDGDAKQGDAATETKTKARIAAGATPEDDADDEADVEQKRAKR